MATETSKHSFYRDREDEDMYGITEETSRRNEEQTMDNSEQGRSYSLHSRQPRSILKLDSSDDDDVSLDGEDDKRDGEKEENTVDSGRSLSTDLGDVEEYIELNHFNKANYQKVFDGTGTKIYESACKHLGLTPDHHAMSNLANSSILIPNRSMNEREVGALMEALINNTKVEELDLSGNFLEDQSCRFIAQMLTHNGFISRVNIGENCIRDSFGAFYKVLMETGTSLKQLYVNKNKISDAAIGKVAPALSSNHCLAVLDLSGNSLMSSQSAVDLFKALKSNFTLISLDLSRNLITGPNVGVSFGVLNKNNSSLKFLSLAGCRLHPSTVERMQKSLIRTDIECLDLSDNHIKQELVKKFAVNLTKENCHLKALFLDRNHIDDEVYHAFVRVLGDPKHLSVLSLVGYRNMLGSIATRDTLVIRESRHMFREVIKCMDTRGLDPVSLFVRSSEKNNIATSDKAPNEYTAEAIRENLKRLFVKLPDYVVEKYLASLGLVNFMQSEVSMDARCKSMIHGLENKLVQEVGMLKMADISQFMLCLFQFRIYCDSPDVKPMIREERFWLLNKTMHCLVLNKLLEWIDPTFRQLSLTELVENLNKEKQPGSEPQISGSGACEGSGTLGPSTYSVIRSEFVNTTASEAANDTQNSVDEVNLMQM